MWESVSFIGGGVLVGFLGGRALQSLLRPKFKFITDPDYVAPSQTVIYMNENRAFPVVVVINNVPIIAMLDQGSHAVSLSWTDAEKVGFEINRAVPASQTLTVNEGLVHTRYGTLRHVTIGHMTARQVIAAMLPPNSTLPSLIGMTFLERFHWKFDPYQKRIVIEESQENKKAEYYDYQCE